MNYHTNFNLMHPDTLMNWRGWDASVAQLMQAGWEIRVSRQPAFFDEYNVVMRHRETGYHGINREKLTVECWYQQWMTPGDRGFSRGRINMQVAGEIVMQSMGAIHNWRDSETRAVELAIADVNKRELLRLDYLFPESGQQPDEIVIEQRPDVITLLNQIKDLQEPRAKEILAEQRRKGKVESFQTTANVIALR